MEFKEIEYILAIEKYNNISKAAKSLYIAQPALSKFLSNLEHQLDTVLFERGNNTLNITEAGRIYVKHAQVIRQELNSLHEELASLKNGPITEVNLGISLNASLFKIRDFREELHRKYPACNLNLLSLHSRQIYENLQNGELSAAIAGVPLDPTLKFDKFFDLPFLVMVPHAISDPALTEDLGAEYPWIDLSRLTHAPLVLQNKNSYIRKEFDQIFHQQGLHFDNVLLEVESSLHAIKYAEQSGCLAFISPSFLPYLSAEDDIDLYVWGKPLATTNIGLIYKAGKLFSPQESYCIQILRSYLEKNFKI